MGPVVVVLVHIVSMELPCSTQIRYITHTGHCLKSELTVSGAHEEPYSDLIAFSTPCSAYLSFKAIDHKHQQNCQQVCLWGVAVLPHCKLMMMTMLTRMALNPVLSGTAPSGVELFVQYLHMYVP